MKIGDAIKQRRSVRRYAEKMPDEKDIEKITAAGTWAPSGLNNQPWKFKIIKDKKEKSALGKLTKYGDVIESAPLVICVFLDNGATYNREKDIMSVGACIQNMLLQAYELGLGTCWLGEILNKKKEAGEYLGTGTDCELMACVSVGYPAGKATKGCRKNLKTFILK